MTHSSPCRLFLLRAGHAARVVLACLTALLASLPPRTSRAEDCPPVAPAPAAATSDDLPPLDPANPQQVQVTSEGAEVTRDGDAVLRGQVRVRQGQRTLRAERAEYSDKTQDFRVSGNVAFDDPKVRVSGDTGTWSADSTATFNNARFELPERGARGSASEISLAADGKLSLATVRYTACPVGNSDWVLKASGITIDQQTQQGYGRNARLDFKGVPILYTPFISFPVGDLRKSGLLFPTLGQSNRSGFELFAPYYLNLAPNYDATLTPGLYSRRGPAIGGEFRYLTESMHGMFSGNWLPNDSVAGRDRSYVQLDHQSLFNPRLRLDASLANASDTSYFEDFGLGPEGTSIAYVGRTAQLTYLDRHWRAFALLQDFQTIDRTIPEDLRPYSRTPQLQVDGSWDTLSGLSFNIGIEAANFERDTGVTGVRLDAQPQIAWEWRRPGVFVKPAVAYQVTQYSLRDTDPGQEKSPSRSAPIATLDAGLIFERAAARRITTLEPRLLYTYIPYRDQDSLPLFDTGVPDLNLIQLFRPERYVGGDRLGDTNQVAAGLTSRFLDAGSGRQFFEATLGQIYYLQRPRVRLPDEPAVSADSSDLVAQVSLTAYRHWNIDLGYQWDPHGERTVKSQLNLQYRPANDSVINLSYRQQAGRLEQWETSFAWPLTREWNVYGRYVYSLKDSKNLESLAGLEYRACCWALRLVARRYVSKRTGEQDTSFGLQLELNGLSTVGSSTGAFLERAIRGYSPPADAPPRS